MSYCLETSLCRVGVVIFSPAKRGLGRWEEEKGFWHPCASGMDVWAMQGGHTCSVWVWFLLPWILGPGERGPWDNPHPLPQTPSSLGFPAHSTLPGALRWLDTSWSLLAPTWHVHPLVQFSFSSPYQRPSFIHLFHSLKRRPLLRIAKSTAAPNYVPLTWSSCRFQLFCLNLLLPSRPHNPISCPLRPPGRSSRTIYLALLEYRQHPLLC